MEAALNMNMSRLRRVPCVGSDLFPGAVLECNPVKIFRKVWRWFFYNRDVFQAQVQRWRRRQGDIKVFVRARINEKSQG